MQPLRQYFRAITNHRCTIRRIVLSLLALGLVASPLRTMGQDKAFPKDAQDARLEEALNRPITLNIRGTTLYDVLSKMFKQANLQNVTIPQKLKRVKTGAGVTDYSLRNALEVILDDSGFAYKRIEGAIRIVPTGFPNVRKFLQSHKEVPVGKLPPGRLRREWEIVRERHPNSGIDAWIMKVGWAPPSMPPYPALLRYTFMRLCPQNRALTLDWATVYVRVFDGKEIVNYEAGEGAAHLPPPLLQRPKMDSRQAWIRVLQALKTLHVSVPSNYPCPNNPVLRIIEDKEENDPIPIRLVWQFAPEKSCWRIAVDVVTGEVGGMQLAMAGDGGPSSGDPMYGFRQHLGFQERWFATTPNLRP